MPNCDWSTLTRALMLSDNAPFTSQVGLHGRHNRCHSATRSRGRGVNRRRSLALNRWLRCERGLRQPMREGGGRGEADGPWPRGLSRERLTPREVSIVLGIARGCSDRDIASTLDLSSHQVTYGVRSLIAKLGANNRAHAVTRAVGAGYIRISVEQCEAYSDQTRESAQKSAQ